MGRGPQTPPGESSTHGELVLLSPPSQALPGQGGTRISARISSALLYPSPLRIFFPRPVEIFDLGILT